MISEEDFASVAGEADPQLAFARLETRFRKVLESNLEGSQSSGAYDSYVIEYMNHTIAAARYFKLGILDFWEVPRRDTSDINEKYHDFITEIDYYKVQIQLAQIRAPLEYSVGLSGPDKEKLRFFVNQMKEIIDAADLEEEKRDELFNKLNKFLEAVDRNRAPWDRFYDIMVSAATVTGVAAEKLEPLRKLIDSVSTLLGHNKQIENSQPKVPSLPKKPPQKQIPDQRTKKPVLKRRGDMDDEIPF